MAFYHSNRKVTKTRCIQCPWRPKDGIRYPGTGVTDSCELPCQCWELNLSLLSEQSVLSTLEPSGEMSWHILKNILDPWKFSHGPVDSSELTLRTKKTLCSPWLLLLHRPLSWAAFLINSSLHQFSYRVWYSICQGASIQWRVATVAFDIIVGNNVFQDDWTS